MLMLYPICTGHSNHGSCKFSILAVLVREFRSIKYSSNLFIDTSTVEQTYTSRCKPLTEPYVRLSRIRLFIIIFAVSKQADINLWHCQWIIFQHFNESFSCVTLSVTSSVQYLKQKLSDLLFVVRNHSSIKADAIVPIVTDQFHIKHSHQFLQRLVSIRI